MQVAVVLVGCFWGAVCGMFIGALGLWARKRRGSWVLYLLLAVGAVCGGVLGVVTLIFYLYFEKRPPAEMSAFTFSALVTAFAGLRIVVGLGTKSGQGKQQE